MTEIVEACPECDGTDYWIRSRTSYHEPKYECPDCGYNFDEPVRRESRSTTPNPRNAKYAHLNWDDLELAGD